MEPMGIEEAGNWIVVMPDGERHAFATNREAWDMSTGETPSGSHEAEHCKTTYVGSLSDPASMQWQRKPPEPEQSLLTMMQA
jgi:hypothetical protein